MRAAISAPYPNERQSSCATTTRLVLLTDVGDGFPIVRGERAQVDDLDGGRRIAALDLGGGEQGFLHQRAVGDDGEAAAGLDDAGAAEGDGEIVAGMRGAVVGLAVELLVLEKHHRVVGAQGGAEQAAGVEGVAKA